MGSDNAGATGPSGPSLATAPNGTTVLAFQQWVGAVGYAQGGQRQPSIEPLAMSGSVPSWRSDRPRAGPINSTLLWLIRSSLSPGTPDKVLEYGGGGNVPITGDWNHDGITDIGVYDNGRWYLRDSLTPGPPNHTIHYGYPGAIPITGDWNHDGTTDIGVYDNGWWYLRDSLTPGPPDHAFYFGYPAVPITGDWNHDGTTDIGLFGDGWWYLRNSLTSGGADTIVNYGAAGYRPVTGAWTTGGDGIAVVVQN